VNPFHKSYKYVLTLGGVEERGGLGAAAIVRSWKLVMIMMTMIMVVFPKPKPLLSVGSDGGDGGDVGGSVPCGIMAVSESDFGKDFRRGDVDQTYE
jgi:hypothetical protein